MIADGYAYVFLDIVLDVRTSLWDVVCVEQYEIYAVK